ncbi:hypothetical protein K1719_008892 [Acacia pycnantha]|nr:hypothetical protein K1719_008892 [Acacia pycnantha]
MAKIQSNELCKTEPWIAEAEPASPIRPPKKTSRVAFFNVPSKIHECPVCFRVFASGQALGGNKRTHLTGSSTLLPTRASTKLVGKFIDLNLPAPTADEDDISQIDNSGVSDAEFLVDRIRQ